MTVHRYSWRQFALMAAFGFALAGCGATIDTRGYVPDPDDLERIKAGVQGRDEVREILGTPSSISAFTDDRWYYISKKTKSWAFLKPEVLEQHVTVVDFDDGGLVKDVRNYALEDGLLIDPVTRKTPAPGRELTFMEQLLGNLGRFNAPTNSSGNPNRR
jgi:outer membrane protein assembly factor BamE (lipoprotein component of BamABCDE complex)